MSAGKKSGSSSGSPTGLPEWLLAAGVALFGAGALAAIATLLPLFFSSERLPTSVYLVAVILAPLGLALCLLSLVAGSARRRRLVREDLAGLDVSGASDLDRWAAPQR